MLVCPCFPACFPVFPIFLTPLYYLESSTDQGITLIHELLHISLGVGATDPAVDKALGISIPAGLNASQALSAWLRNDCTNQ
jgi:hypothetical protein